jgi:hypothetical protein
MSWNAIPREAGNRELSEGGMRDQYAGDISDYLKFSFIRYVVPRSAVLGVAWYYLPNHDGRADGRHDEYLSQTNWRVLDPDLFDRLKQRNEQSVAGLEALGILPAPTIFHRTPVPGRRERDSWARQMHNALAPCSSVFADPDNGVSRRGLISRKSATVEEVFELCGHGRLCLLIRFPHRLASHAEQLARYHEAFARFAPITLRTCVRVPNANGTTSPRIRWFTALNARNDVRERIADFAIRAGALPGASITKED